MTQQYQQPKINLTGSDSGFALTGVVVTEDYVVTNDVGIIWVDSSAGEIKITFPDCTDFNKDYFWQVIKVSNDFNRVQLCLEIPEQSGYFQEGFVETALFIKGQALEAKLNSATNLYYYSDISGTAPLNAPTISTTGAVISGTDLTMSGVIDSLGGFSQVITRFRYRQEGTTTWTETTPVTETEAGSVADVIVTINPAFEYEVQFLAEYTLGTVVGAIIITSDNYYADISAAVADSLVRYWALEESVGVDTVGVDTMGSGDDLAFSGGVTIVSETINGFTRYYRNFTPAPAGFAESTYILNNANPWTFMIRINTGAVTGDHTIFSNGTNRVSLASDFSSIQLEVNGTITSWASATPFGGFKTIFVVNDGSLISVYETNGSAEFLRTSIFNFLSVPGQFFRFGRAAVNGLATIFYTFCNLF